MKIKEWIAKVKKLSTEEYAYDMTEAYDAGQLLNFSLDTSPEDFIKWQAEKYDLMTVKELTGYY